MGQGLLFIQASRSHSDTPHAVGLLWTSDQPVREDLYLTTHIHSKQTDIHVPGGFEPAITASQRTKTHSLEEYRTGHNSATFPKSVLV
jgi:hypothetical protein